MPRKGQAATSIGEIRKEQRGFSLSERKQRNGRRFVGRHPEEVRVAKQTARDKAKVYWATHDPYQEIQPKTCSTCGVPKLRIEFQRNYSMADGLTAFCKECARNKYIADYVKLMVRNAGKRAKLFNLDFNLTEEDVVIPDACPVLGIPLSIGSRRMHDNSPSLDRWDNNKGYTIDNTRVISWRANQLKSDANVEEMEKVLVYMKGASNG